MKILTWSFAAVLLAGLTVCGDEPPTKGTLEQIRKQEVERLRATEAYYRGAGKISSAQYYRILADRAEKKAARVPTIYVPILKSEGIPREQALRLTEWLQRALERDLGYKVVGSPDDADLIFDGGVKPAPRPRP